MGQAQPLGDGPGGQTGGQQHDDLTFPLCQRQLLSFREAKRRGVSTGSLRQGVRPRQRSEGRSAHPVAPITDGGEGGGIAGRDEVAHGLEFL
jgi:hypothetical protein